MLPIMKPILAILRALVKAIPLANPIIEAIENRKARKEIAKGEILNGSTKIKMVEGKAEQPHDWLSIGFQILVIGAFVYAFVTEKITAEKLIELLNYFTK